MSIKIQIICMLVSFMYGFILKILLIINKLLTKNNNKYINIISKIIYTYIVVILYIIIIYKINKGIFHIYFIILILLGYYLMSKYVKFISKKINKIFIKKKKMIYYR
jgi:hypothetical protein